MRDLIYQQVHLRTQAQGRLWATNQRLIRRLNPDCDFLVIDNASPLDPLAFDDRNWSHMQLKPMDEHIPVLPETTVGSIIRFHESLGHFHYGHSHGLPVRDGPGRAFNLALRSASCSGYRRVCYIESDALFRHPVSWVFDQMKGWVGCQPRCAYGYLDWHVWPIKDMARFMAFDFLGKYDWKNRVGEPGGEKCGEHIYAEIFGDELEVVPMTGIRGDTVDLNEGNFARHFPAGSDYITHVNLTTFALWLEATGHGDLAAGLLG